MKVLFDFDYDHKRYGSVSVEVSRENESKIRIWALYYDRVDNTIPYEKRVEQDIVFYYPLEMEKEITKEKVISDLNEYFALNISPNFNDFWENINKEKYNTTITLIDDSIGSKILEFEDLTEDDYEIVSSEVFEDNSFISIQIRKLPEDKNFEVKLFDCHFAFNTIVQIHGRDEEGAIENINKIFNDNILSGSENIMGCGIGFDDDIKVVKEVENGWFELNLLWSGSWSIDAINETNARRIAKTTLDELLTPFYQMLEEEADNSRFEFKNLENGKIIDVLEV